MLKKIVLFAVTLAASFTALSQTAVLPISACITISGVHAKTSGMNSSNYLEGVIPSCTVTVYLTGTTTVATTSPQSPFTANMNGSIPPIYAATGVGYDVVLSGGISPNTYPSPVTLTGLYPMYGGGSGSMTWPSGAAGIPNYSGRNSWGTSYNASNPIPANFLTLSGLCPLTGCAFTGPVSTPNLIAKGSPWFDVTAYGATGNAQKGVDGVTTTGGSSTTFTSAAGPFNCSTDVGKVIQIQSAGAAGIPLLTTIAGCASAYSVTLTTGASTAATGQMFFWGTDDAYAIIAARNAAGAVGGTVFFPTGTYLVSAYPIITTTDDAPISFEGTCSFMGARVISLAGASPVTTCSTILDGSNNQTFEFNSAHNFRVKGISFLSFPNSLNEFVVVQGKSDGTAEAFNGIIEENSFWGKQYASYGFHITENIQWSRNTIGCASVAGIEIDADLPEGANKDVIEDNYMDFQGACQALPTYGILVTNGGGTNLGTVTNTSILRNEVQNATTNAVYAIRCIACMGFNITGNDIESNVGPNGWVYGITVAPSTLIASINGTIGTNTIVTSYPMTAAVGIHTGSTNVAPQNIIASATVTYGVLVYNAGYNTVALPSPVSGNVTNLITQTAGAFGTTILGKYYVVDSYGNILLTPDSGMAEVMGADVAITPKGTGTGLFSNYLCFQYASSTSPSEVCEYVDPLGDLTLSGAIGANIALKGQVTTDSTFYMGSQNPTGGVGGANSNNLAFVNILGSGIVNTSGTLTSGAYPVTWVSGTNFTGYAAGQTITLYQPTFPYYGIFTIAASPAPTSTLLYVTTSPGTQSGVTYSYPQFANIYTDYVNNYIHFDRPLSVNGLYNSNGLLLPSTLTGYHGTGAGDVKVQFSDGTGTSTHLAAFDANGGLTDGGAVPTGTVTSVDGTASAGAETVVSGSVAAITSSGIIRGAFPYISETGNVLATEAMRGHFLVTSDAGADTYTLPTPSGANFQNGWYYEVKNTGAGVVTFTPAGSTTIDGVASLAIGKVDIKIESDGTNYHSTLIGPVSQNAQGLVFASPAAATGPPSMRALVATDIPSLSYQAPLSLVAGTYTDGKMCTYTSSGTLLNCNTTIPAQVAANLASSSSTGVTGQLPIGQVGSAGLSASNGIGIASTGAISLTYGTTANTVAQGNDSRIVGAAQCTAGTAAGNCITNGMSGVGDLLYGGASGASTKLSGYTGGDGVVVVLTETTSGTGTAQAPAWTLASTLQVSAANSATNVNGATNCILYNSSTNTTGCISGVNNAVVVTNGSGVPSEVTTLPAANLPAQYKIWSCQPGLGDGLNAITAGTYLQTECKNTTGVSVTLTGLSCYVDGGTASTMNASGNTLGALLTGAVTCSTSFAAGTQSANVTLTNGDYIKFTFVADGTAKQTTWVVTGTY